MQLIKAVGHCARQDEVPPLLSQGKGMARGESAKIVCQQLPACIHKGRQGHVARTSGPLSETEFSCGHLILRQNEHIRPAGAPTRRGKFDISFHKVVYAPLNPHVDDLQATVEKDTPRVNSIIHLQGHRHTTRCPYGTKGSEERVNVVPGRGIRAAEPTARDYDHMAELFGRPGHGVDELIDGPSLRELADVLSSVLTHNFVPPEVA